MNNIEISMENLFPTLKDQPRLLVQIFDLLFRLIMAESDTKTFLCKVCSGISPLYPRTDRRETNNTHGVLTLMGIVF